MMIAAVAAPGFSPAADSPSAGRPLSNYRIEIEIKSADGPPRHYALATTGGRVEGSWVAPGMDLGPAEAPGILKFAADVQEAGPDQLWLRDVRLGQSVPIVTGVRPGMPVAARAFNENRRGAERPFGGIERPNRVERRPAREEAASQETPPGDEPPSPPVASPGRPMAPTMAPIRSITYQDVGTISSVVLRLGKPLVVSEDDSQRVILTAKRVEE